MTKLFPSLYSVDSVFRKCSTLFTSSADILQIKSALLKKHLNRSGLLSSIFGEISVTPNTFFHICILYSTKKCISGEIGYCFTSFFIILPSTNRPLQGASIAYINNPKWPPSVVETQKTILNAHVTMSVTIISSVFFFVLQVTFSVRLKITKKPLLIYFRRREIIVPFEVVNYHLRYLYVC